ncbi:unnamed protein product [Rodentolepis nana]|uniref:Uncharacterized protein n=1 Tax=Rodentolepis nana TaxID=102285 RepID=A0A3P7SIC7_RODNA|nr:unnamed protein product [Rodentolepis nana]
MIKQHLYYYFMDKSKNPWILAISLMIDINAHKHRRRTKIAKIQYSQMLLLGNCQ